MAARREKAKDVKSSQSKRFETDFGEPIRDELRTFLKAIRTLRVFTLPAGTAPDQRIAELTDCRADWDKAAADVEALLREADDSPFVTADYWGETWQDNITQAETALQALQDLAEPTDENVQQFAREAYTHYNRAVDHARSGLTTEREKLAPDPPLTMWEGIKKMLDI